MPRAASDPDREGGEARHGDLPAVTRALEVLAERQDETSALSESFAAAVQAFAAEKALLLRVKQASPLEMESLSVVGLDPSQVDAAVAGRSVEGVSASLIRKAIEAGESQLVENSQFDGRHATETGALTGRPHSVLCAPVTDPWTRSVLAVLYFQTAAGPRAYTRGSSLSRVRDRPGHARPS
jgi:hypothetical protein